MTVRTQVFLLVLFFASSNAFASTPSDPLAEQKRIQKLNTSVPKDPNAEFKKSQDPNAELRKIQKLNNDHAILFYTEGIKKSPKDAALYAKRGKVHSWNNNYELAQADFDKALTLNPKLADAYVGRAVIYLMKKDYDKSWENVHKAESLGGEFWPAFTESLKSGSGREK